MITRIEALNYRCLRYISQELGRFHVLVGPNASGKTTFLDVVAFLGDLVSEGLDEAIKKRADDFFDLVWMHKGEVFELAIEARIPENLRQTRQKFTYNTIRYEIRLKCQSLTDPVEIADERVLLKSENSISRPHQPKLAFPDQLSQPNSVLAKSGSKGTKTIVSKTREGNDIFRPEAPGGWQHTFKLGPRKSALGNLPEDEENYPASSWLKQLLQDGIQQLVLNSRRIRLASPPHQSTSFIPDGSNLPWVVSHIKENAPALFDEWIEHLKTALEDLKDIRVIRREDDGYQYIVLLYSNGLEIPSWVASDGTLRLLALTLPAYLPEYSGILMVEEPENGIHPTAVKSVVQSLQSVYDAQVLLATHSPVILSEVEPEQVLCFAKTTDGSTDIVLGSEHPKLRDWQRESSLGVLFAAGVLS